MSTLVDLLQQSPEADIFEAAVADCEAAALPQPGPWDPEHFAQEQIRGLVRQVFFAQLKPARQVVFCPLDDKDIAGFCLRVGDALSAQSQGSVCVVEANLRAWELRGLRNRPQQDSGEFGRLRNSAQQISSTLWRIPIDIFLSHSEDNLSADWVRAALRELRLDFDYTLFHGPPAGQYSETALLGQLTDGVVLVLEANSTRRVAAQKAIQKLHAGNARLLGTVLNNRTFPIPERIYRKL
jgi:hypothetical protein